MNCSRLHAELAFSSRVKDSRIVSTSEFGVMVGDMQKKHVAYTVTETEDST
jgi:hypothetical protein